MKACWRNEAGQSLAETALVVPVLAVLLFGVVALCVLIGAKVGAEAAAREAAREVATSPRPYDFAPGHLRAREVLQGYRLDPARATVQVWGDPSRQGSIAARVSYQVDLSWVPFPFLPDTATVHGTHTEKVEQYRSRE